MKRHFLELFEYNHWANQRILAVLEEKNVNDEKILKLFSHLISAQIVWLHRIKDMPVSPFPLWEVYKLRELKSMVGESSRNWINYIRTEHPGETFEEMIFYKNSEGVKYETTIRHIATHVINHSTYHRAQIAAHLRILNIDPPVTDFIAYSREKI